MKIRTDFVTNSSSSSFTVLIVLKLADDGKLMVKSPYSAKNDVVVTVSLKQLGKQQSISTGKEPAPRGVVHM